MNGRVTITVCALVATTALACNTHDDVRLRYELEKKLSDAQQMEISAGASAHSLAVQRAVARYRDILTAKSLMDPPDPSWRSNVVRDIQDLLVESELSMVALKSSSYRALVEGTYFTPFISRYEMTTRRSQGGKLDLTSALYADIDTDSLDLECTNLFARLIDNSELWEGNLLFSKEFLEKPLFMASIQELRGNKERFDRCAGLADVFYTKVAAGARDRKTVEQARFLHARLRCLQGEYEAADKEMLALLRYPTSPEREAEFLLWRADILCEGLGETDKAFPVYFQIVTDHNDQPASYPALLSLAHLNFERGNTDRAMEILEQLEGNAQAPESIRARAMLAHALYLTKKEGWDEAVQQMQRLCKLYPHTSAAVEAPLIAVRHYAATGDAARSSRVLDRAQDFYLSLITDKESFVPSTLIVEDYLIECYLACNEPREIADLLEKDGQRWGGNRAVSALYKSGMIRMTLLKNNDDAKRAFEKCIHLFPQTGYAVLAQHRLNMLELNEGDNR